ncbi:uncharacterized protein LOC107885764, partial [Acyrthosiphon pisum]|uniref:MULE transposase domain-containing protein n=1 Tax=Acyrthosiphon pisum TaxID=7029 RepID=A0A8R2D897_ACYPI
FIVLTKESVVKRTIRNQRTNNNPALNCINDIVIEDDWALVNGQQFLLADNKSTTGERIVLFSTDDSLKMLTEAKTWYCDGNFNLSPKYFLQLYVIRVQKNDSYITAVYCLLERKTMSIYEEMFKLIRKMKLEVAADKAKLAIDSMGEPVKKKKFNTYPTSYFMPKNI